MKERDPILERGLPQELEAEKAFLGSILLDQSVIDQAATLLTPDDLYLHSHQKLFRVQLNLAATGQPIDIVTLTSELRKRDEFAAVGGATYISSLIDHAVRTDNLKPYATLIKEAALKRRLLRTCADITEEIYGNDAPFADIVQKAEEAVFVLAESRRGDQGPEHVAVVSARLVDFYEQKSADPHKLIGLSFGYEDLDKQTLGLVEGLTLIAARQSMGKTALAINVSCNVALRGGGSVYFASLESGAEKIVQRILASEARVDSLRMRSGYMNREEWARLHDALQALSVTRFVVDDTSDLTPEELGSRARQYQSQNGLDLLVVDYIQLMARRLQYARRHRELRFAIQEVGAKLVGLSRSLHVPILALAQLSRTPDDRPGHRPQVSDLGESASLEQDADVIMLLLRDEQYKRTDENRGIATVIFGKQRDGGTDRDVSMAFFREFTRFEPLAKSEWPVSREDRRQAARHRRDYAEREEPENDD